MTGKKVNKTSLFPLIYRHNKKHLMDEKVSGDLARIILVAIGETKNWDGETKNWDGDQDCLFPHISMSPSMIFQNISFPQVPEPKCGQSQGVRHPPWRIQAVVSMGLKKLDFT